ncbi:MAG: hypothetical protein HRU00_09830 [Myxococcales bacterium]|nr:hypothetical protein [Myxococcales bacterium]
MTTFETGVWQATYGAAMAGGASPDVAAVHAQSAINGLRFAGRQDWMPVREGNYELPPEPEPT